MKVQSCQQKTRSATKALSAEEEMVSNAHRRMHFSGSADNECDIDIGAMHPNVGNTVTTAHNVEIIKSLIDIAKNTGQSSKMMDFPQLIMIIQSSECCPLVHYLCILYILCQLTHGWQ